MANSVTPRAILPRWINVTEDNTWVGSLLSWYGGVYPDCRAVCVETSLQSRRPDLREDLVLDQDKIFNKEGEVFAIYHPSQLTDFRIRGPIASRQFRFRFSDESWLRATPLAYYFLLMGECMPLERPKTAKLDIQLVATPLDLLLPAVNSMLTVEFTQTSASVWHFQIASNSVLCQAIWELDLTRPSEPRYEITREVMPSRATKERARLTRNLDNEPVRFHLRPFPFEINPTNLAFSFMSQATLALSELFEHIFAPDSTGPKAPKAKTMTTFWRSATVHVFDKSVDCSKTGLDCLCWLDRTGSSSFDLRVDFTNPHTRAVVASTRKTMVLIEIANRKPMAVHYDRAWAQRRYAYGKQSSVTSDMLQLNVPQLGWSSPAYQHKLELRHADQDLNAHVNSIVYVTLIQDARFAAQQAGYFPANLREVGKSIKTWIEYVGELHYSTQHAARIQVSYQLKDNSILWTRFEFFSDFDTPGGKPCTIVHLESEVVMVGASKI